MKSFFQKESILIIIVSIVCGGLAGILGISLVGLNDWQIPFFGRVNVADTDADRQIVIDQPRSVTVEQDVQVKQIENNLMPALINIYHAKKTGSASNQAYLPAEILGQGIVFTANGWMLAPSSAIANLKVKYSAVGYQLKQSELANFVADPATGLVFGQIGGRDLPVAQLGTAKNIALGQTLIVVSQRANLVLAHVKKIGYRQKTSQDLIQSSEALNREIFLDVELDRNFIGAAVADLKGAVVGVFDGNKIIAVDYFKDAVNQVLANKKIGRAVLGVKYIDLALAEGLIDFGDKGALLIGSPAKTSPAYNQLKDGDVIKKVDDVELNSSQNLSEILSGYRSGDIVDFLIQRAGKEATVEVKLQ